MVTKVVINYMKKFFFICIALFLGLIAIIIQFPNKNTAKQTETQNNKFKTYQYKLADHNGYIALFHVNKTEPVEVYNILTDSLPVNDIKTLKNGIYAQSVEELALLLEEYTS